MRLERHGKGRSVVQVAFARSDLEVRGRRGRVGHREVKVQRRVRGNARHAEVVGEIRRRQGQRAAVNLTTTVETLN